MKKNTMMRIASAMLVLALLTTCVISGTFARYVTATQNEGETARVAKWGVTVTGTGNMFAEEYDSDTEGVTGVTVKSLTKVVAPGTKGTLASFSVTGTPQVSFRVSYTATVADNGKWKYKANDTSEAVDYMPLQFKVNGTACAYANLAATINNYYKEYSVGDPIGSNDYLTIEWVWPIGTATEDPKDTYLGNLTGEDVPTVTVTINAIATQID